MSSKNQRILSSRSAFKEASSLAFLNFAWAVESSSQARLILMSLGPSLQ